MSRFSDYTDNVRDGEMPWRYELVDPSGELLATTDVDEAAALGSVKHWAVEAPPVTFDRFGRSVRTSQIMVPVTDTAFVPERPGSLLHPDTGNRVRIYGGLTNGGSTTWWLQGSMLVDDAAGVSDGGAAWVDVDLLDATAPVQKTLTTSFSFDADEPVETVVERLLALVLPSDGYSITPTGCTVPPDTLDPGTDLDSVVAELLGGCGHELFADLDGVVASRLVPGSGDQGQPERWRYGQSDGLPVGRCRRVTRRREPRGVLVKGGSLLADGPGISRRVFDTDPASQGFFGSASSLAVELPSVDYSWIGSVGQADDAGYAELRRTGFGPGMVEFEAVPNPAMQPYDLIEFENELLNASGTYQVLGMSLPMVIEDGSPMTVLARQLWLPDLQFRRSVPRNPGFETSFTDNFDRADEDLQGSVWTEYGWSWGVVGNAAIQRYDGGWSLALVNKAMKFSDHRATTSITKLPVGRPCGPLIRSSGTFEGYAALVDSTGFISLESWIAGERDATLATHDSGLDPVGRDLRVQALGSTISVTFDGTTVISISDDRHLGNQVGMLAYGGPPGNAPTVDSFTAAQAA